MRIESVTAEAFGPLVDARLELAPGLTVIVGANESAKSSWHAAIYAGLCGRRRGRGGVTRVDRSFEELRRPWDGDAWRACVVVRLDDGRRIEITQDLAGRVDSRAVDADLGRDVSGDIMFEGSPDGSRWLGLDRYSFLATACIGQAALLKVLDEADGLQDHIARAAATAGTDANAATALAGIAAFRREQVGLDKQGARRRLRTAKEAVAAMTAALVSARADHERYVDIVTEAETARQAAGAAQADVVGARDRASALERLLAAARAADEAAAEADRSGEKAQALLVELDAARRRLARVEELDAAFAGREPTAGADADGVTRGVAEALARWRESSAPAPLTGDSAASLREQLDRLPGVPAGDREVDATVRQAAQSLAQAHAVVVAHRERRPVEPGADEDPELAAAVDASAAVVRDLAADLAAARSVVAPDPQALVALDEVATSTRARADELRASAEAAAERSPGAAPAPVAGSTRRTMLLAGAGAALAAGLVLLVLRLPLPGVVAVALAVGLAAWGLGTWGARGDATDGNASGTSTAAPQWAQVSAAERTALAANEELRAARAAGSAAASMLADARERCETRGLPADVPRLRALAAAAEHARDQRTALAQWSSDATEYELAELTAGERLRTALAGRGVAVEAIAAADVPGLATAYERDCATRAAAATAAARRPDLLLRLAEREGAEQALADAASRHRSAAADIMTAAALAGVAPDDADGHADADADAADHDAHRLARRLAAWQQERALQVRAADQSRGDWAELAVLLDGSTPQELRRGVADTGRRQAELVGLAEAAAARSTGAADGRDARARAAGLDPAGAGDVAEVAGLVAAGLADLEQARDRASVVASAADRAEAVRRERAATLRSVAGAEESLATEQARLDRVSVLAATLDLTAEFLMQAQDRVHRDIAPVLVRTLERWLPSVTGGRYVNARVDPATLVVQVRGPGRPWRQADRLSVGTAEQVYLLLRVALAEHLTTTDETCPLLLDDVTVQADPVRTEAILDLLLQLSQDRQIVLFAQEPMVADWARRALSGEDTALIELPQLTSA